MRTVGKGSSQRSGAIAAGGSATGGGSTGADTSKGWAGAVWSGSCVPGSDGGAGAAATVIVLVATPAALLLSTTCRRKTNAPAAVGVSVAVGPVASSNAPSLSRSHVCAPSVPSASVAVEVKVIGCPTTGWLGLTVKLATGGRLATTTDLE